METNDIGEVLDWLVKRTNKLALNRQYYDKLEGLWETVSDMRFQHNWQLIKGNAEKKRGEV